MRLADFDLSLVRDVVADQGSNFYTADVSQDPRMLAHHRVNRMNKAERDSYLQMTGRFLSENRPNLGIRLAVERKQGRGRRWDKIGLHPERRRES